MFEFFLIAYSWYRNFIELLSEKLSKGEATEWLNETRPPYRSRQNYILDKKFIPKNFALRQIYWIFWKIYFQNKK